MDSRRSVFALMAGCAVVVLLAVLAVGSLVWFSSELAAPFAQEEQGPQLIEEDDAIDEEDIEAQPQVPTLTPAGPRATEFVPEAEPPFGTGAEPSQLVTLFDEVSPGVVSIRVFVEQAGGLGAGAGSGFILDEAGHIVTNYHVVADAAEVTVVFSNGFEAPAEVIGVDPDSDLAVLRVEQLPEGAHPLPLGDSDDVQVGEWVVAIGNPFGVGTSMSVGIVSAIGRQIASGATPFSIPEAIQTDAAINPGNSGGPLIRLSGEVVGVNAQIATAGARASAGVGFAIPANVVRRVVPVLIERGNFLWPWLGVSGEDVNLLLAQANELETQRGAYIHEVDPEGPAAEAGLQGTTGTELVSGAEVPVGGDVVVAANGEPIGSFGDLLAFVASQRPDETVTLTVQRNGETVEVPVTLEPRPTFGQ